MKKILLTITLLLLSIFTLVSCNNTTNKTKKTNQQEHKNNKKSELEEGINNPTNTQKQDIKKNLSNNLEKVQPQTDEKLESENPTNESNTQKQKILKKTVDVETQTNNSLENNEDNDSENVQQGDLLGINIDLEVLDPKNIIRKDKYGNIVDKDGYVIEYNLEKEPKRDFFKDDMIEEPILKQGRNRIPGDNRSDYERYEEALNKYYQKTNNITSEQEKEEDTRYVDKDFYDYLVENEFYINERKVLLDKSYFDERAILRAYRHYRTKFENYEIDFETYKKMLKKHMPNYFISGLAEKEYKKELFFDFAFSIPSYKFILHKESWNDILKTLKQEKPHRFEFK